MMIRTLFMVLLMHLSLGCTPGRNSTESDFRQPEEVVFWHFWGGEDRVVVEHVATRFNQSQSKYHVRPIAMPGNNLNAKLFLSVAGGDPPDLVNQDDPVLADWATRGLIQPIDAAMSGTESEKLEKWLFPAAKSLSMYDGQFFAVCNGLDIRALYFNRTALQEEGFVAPETIGELDAIADHFAGLNSRDSNLPLGYLPDSRRLWAWSYVFGGSFLDPASNQLTIDSAANVAALNWMSGHYERVGIDRAIAFRSGDQSLPGKTFPLLPVQGDQNAGRYVMMMDGQWRVRDINRFLAQRETDNLTMPEFGACSLPVPSDDSLQPRTNAGWVNGNVFMVPAGARNPSGAWEFIKFWIGFNDPAIAAKTCEAGGWIPVSPEVVQTDSFQKYLKREPLFASFVGLAASPNQFPTPKIPGALKLQRTVNAAAYDAMTHPDKNAVDLLRSAQAEIQTSFDRMDFDHKEGSK